ncbi:hypothetical protein, partial [Streptomyces lavendulae]|uniref:hypothetical protein n=1 Tax=Streptomyces lavendulae TaxID=1914 RepID=UPI0031E9D3E9
HTGYARPGHLNKIVLRALKDPKSRQLAPVLEMGKDSGISSTKVSGYEPAVGYIPAAGKSLTS